MTLDVHVITRVFLKENGYDGLCNPDLECGCFKEDLFPCGFAGVESCRPGYRAPIEPSRTYGEGCDGIFLSKPEPREPLCTESSI